jgi:hypothetical protein
MKKTRKSFGLLGIFLVLEMGCAAGRHHTSDSRLEQNFFRNQSKFQTLLVDVMADEKLRMIGRGEIRYGDCPFLYVKSPADVERLGLTWQRWAAYQALLRDLDLVQIFGGHGGVSFKADHGSLFNGDSDKGYSYEAAPPVHQKMSLDDYRISEEDKDKSGDICIYKHIKGNWYLYLFINR